MKGPSASSDSGRKRSPLPTSGDVWPKDQRKLWLQLLEGSFDLIYKDRDVMQ